MDSSLALSGAYLSKKIVLLKAARTSRKKGTVFLKVRKDHVTYFKVIDEK
jgi:hypothetical protein